MTTLTVQEIKDLAEFAGLSVSDERTDMNPDYKIQVCRKESGFEVLDEDAGKTERYAVVAKCDGCDYNETQPLGSPIAR